MTRFEYKSLKALVSVLGNDETQTLADWDMSDLDKLIRQIQGR